MPQSIVSIFATLLPAFKEDGPLLPNLEYFKWGKTTAEFALSIPMLLSARTTSIHLNLLPCDGTNEIDGAMIGSVVAAIPRQCPNIRSFSIDFGTSRAEPGDPTFPAGLSTFLLTTNRDILQAFVVDSTLTGEGYEVVCGLPNLCELGTAVGGLTPLPTLVLPHLTDMTIRHDQGYDWLQGLRGAVLGMLETLNIVAVAEYGLVGDFFKAFEDAKLTTLEALTTFQFHTVERWSPNYHSLLRSPLPLARLQCLSIRSRCDHGFSWPALDDDVITDLVQAMPRLEFLALGHQTLCETPTGVTALGLAAIAIHCPGLATLHIHLLPASFGDHTVMAAALEVLSGTPGQPCTLGTLSVGLVSIEEESVAAAAMGLALLFPSLEGITAHAPDQRWVNVMALVNSTRLPRWRQ